MGITDNNRLTALAAAVDRNHLACVRALVEEFGAEALNPTQQTTLGPTVLELASKNPRILSFLAAQMTNVFATDQILDLLQRPGLSPSARAVIREWIGSGVFLGGLRELCRCVYVFF